MMKTEDIKKCNSIKDYLKILKKDSIDELTFNEIADWVKADKMDVISEMSLEVVECGHLGHFPDKIKATELLKQALKENKRFECGFIMNESCEGANEDENITYFGMGLI